MRRNPPCRGVCGTKIVKNGQASLNTIQWRCTACEASTL
ncbi:hypothetical protein [Schaalia cardiffensis]